MTLIGRLRRLCTLHASGFYIYDMPKRVSLHVALLLFTLITCAAEPHLPSDSSTPIRTDKMSYTLDVDEYRYLLTLEATYTNRTGALVYFTRFCGNLNTPEFSLDKRLPSGWVTAL